MKQWTTEQAPTVYEWTGPTGVKFRQIKEPSGVYYHADTPRPVVDALERARSSHATIRLFTGDLATGKEWFDEYDVCGTVGNSMGPIKIPILLTSPRSHGGGAISDNSIVRLLVNGREVWKHPKWTPSEFSVHPVDPEAVCSWRAEKPDKSLLSMGYTHCLKINGEVHGNFKSEAKARRRAEFMRGDRMRA